MHWEWSRRCRAWRWEAIDEWRRVCGTTTAVISSCQVNLRCPESNKLLGHEWRIESTSPSFARNIHCPCPSPECRDKHAVSLGKALKSTSYYSPEFAKRVIFHMLRDDQFIASKASLAQRQRELQELQDVSWDECQCRRFRNSGSGLLCPRCLEIPGCFVASGMSRDQGQVEAKEGDKLEDFAPFSSEDKERVLKQLHHLHRATGHGSYDSLIRSLEHRKADPRVIQLAREFRCSTCEERKRPAPRRLANLEVSTERGKVVQMDAAWWAPNEGDSRNKCQFVMIVLPWGVCSEMMGGVILRLRPSLTLSMSYGNHVLAFLSFSGQTQTELADPRSWISTSRPWAWKQTTSPQMLTGRSVSLNGPFSG